MYQLIPKAQVSESVKGRGKIVSLTPLIEKRLLVLILNVLVVVTVISHDPCLKLHPSV